MIISFDLKKRGKESKQLFDLKSKVANKKILLVHHNHSVVALDIFAKSVYEFVKKNDEYTIVVSSDSILTDDEELYEKFKSICPNSYHFIFNDPFEFIELLKSVDTVLTSKLHTGVVSTMFGKSVISVADHYEKTRRYYKIIDQSHRCIDLNEAGSHEVIELLNNYVGKAITIPVNVTEQSKKHREGLVSLIESIR